MKKKSVSFVPVLFLIFVFTAATASAKTIEGKGKVTSVDPMFRQVTIEHGALPGFAGDEATAFTVTEAVDLTKVNVRDLVDFTVEEKKGDVRVVKISVTGVAPAEKKPTVGDMVQGVLVTTGDAAKAVTEPIPPAHEVVSGTVGAATGATGAVLEGADTQLNQEF